MENEIKFELGDIVCHKADKKQLVLMTIHKKSISEITCKYFYLTSYRFETTMFLKSELQKITS
jgi:hypothetical protein